MVGRWPGVPAGLILASVLAAVCLLVGGDGPSGGTRVAAADGGVTFYCGWDAGCPEVTIGGDPLATLGGGPSPFRGYADPSLEADPDTGTLWLAYSWVDLLVSSPGPPPVVDLGVQTHLARSDDGGATFTFVRAVNEETQATHPDSGAQGWVAHEVSTLVREGPGAWQMQWLNYFDGFGQPADGSDNRSDNLYVRSVASTPAGLGDTAVPWIRGWATSPSYGAAYDLSSTIPELSDCAAFTEPALFARGGAIYLATSCVVVANGARQYGRERLVLLRQEMNGYSYVGTLLDYSDAIALGGTRLEGADLSVARNGAVLLIVSPLQDATPNNLGCVALEVSDITTASVRRDGSGDPVPLATLTGDDPQIGPVACTYDAASSTGVIMWLHRYQAQPFDVLVSLRATGVHPLGLDSDGDGVADSGDDCRDAANPDQTNTDTALSAGGATLFGSPLPTDSDGDACDSDDDNDGYSDVVETAIATNPLDNCPGGSGTGGDSWPLDNNGNGAANVIDVLAYKGQMPHAVDGAHPKRLDLDDSGVLNVLDVLNYKGRVPSSCT